MIPFQDEHDSGDSKRQRQVICASLIKAMLLSMPSRPTDSKHDSICNFERCETLFLSETVFDGEIRPQRLIRSQVLQHCVSMKSAGTAHCEGDIELSLSSLASQDMH